MDLFERCRIRYLQYLDTVRGTIVSIFRPDLYASLAGFVYLAQLCFIVYQQPARREIRSFEYFHYFVRGDVFVTKVRRGDIAHLTEIEGAYIRCHTNGNAHIWRHEHVRERCGHERRLLHGAVIVVYHINGVLFYARKDLG
mgnify:CR=1 FL=1